MIQLLLDSGLHPLTQPTDALGITGRRTVGAGFGDAAVDLALLTGGSSD